MLELREKRSGKAHETCIDWSVDCLVFRVGRESHKIRDAMKHQTRFSTPSQVCTVYSGYHNHRQHLNDILSNCEKAIKICG